MHLKPSSLSPSWLLAASDLLSGHGRSTCSGFETTNQRSTAPGHANWSPTLSNRSLPFAVGNGFREPETGGAERPKRGADRPTLLHSELATKLRRVRGGLPGPGPSSFGHGHFGWPVRARSRPS